MGRKKTSFERGRIEFKAPPEWVERATLEGERLGLNLSAFIRMAVTQWMDRTLAERTAQQEVRERFHAHETPRMDEPSRREGGRR
jgi:hypothetical protein